MRESHDNIVSEKVKKSLSTRSGIKLFLYIQIKRWCAQLVHTSNTPICNTCSVTQIFHKDLRDFGYKGHEGRELERLNKASTIMRKKWIIELLKSQKRANIAMILEQIVIEKNIHWQYNVCEILTINIVFKTDALCCIATVQILACLSTTICIIQPCSQVFRSYFSNILCMGEVIISIVTAFQGFL